MELSSFFQRRRLILVTFFFSLILTMTGQMSVSPVKDPASVAGKKGIIYALPRTTLVIEVQVERTEQIKGPLAQYAETYLGISDIIKENKTTYSIEAISVKPVSEPDPVNYYFIEWGSKTERPLSIKISPQGTLMGYKSITEETDRTMNRNEEFEYISPAGAFPFYRAGAMKEQIDSIIRKVSIDTLYFESLSFKKYLKPQNEEDKATEAAQVIAAIKKDKYNLLVGYQETAYEKDALEFMMSRLEDMEREYLKLFTGVTYHQSVTYSFTYTPPADLMQQADPLFGFNEGTGIIQPKKDGTDVAIIINPLESCVTSSTSDIVFPAQGLIFRMPCIAEVIINHGVKQQYSQRLPINQIGMLSMLPQNVTEVEFNPETGVPVNISLKP